ncbi:hypothetical protein PR202_gb06898 [Eleusine coracana subsp. coracana]|uniref:Protein DETOXIFICATION n=1 Tax=Eleusine coracana subsp. coracana TaxID=191504 RepID=A0AAV5E8C1_ELECO|nr:hypothetical protein PR202_gb06898 [Eleusine coracana subsp. coracana]
MYKIASVLHGHRKQRSVTSSALSNNFASMEAPFLPAKGGEKKHGGEESSVRSEVTRQLYLAGPLVAGYLLVNIVQVISLMFFGHLSKVEFAGASVATAFAAVTGFSLLAGMGSSLETLCGQAFGAGQYHVVGVYKQRAMLVLAVVSVPLAAVWANAGEILAWFGQDPEIAAAAGTYMRWLIPALFLFGQLHCHMLFLQTQNVVVPVMLSSAAAAIAHPAVCWLLVCRLGLGSKGVALGISVSYLLNVSIMALYVRLSPSCKATWTGFSVEAFRDIPSFLKLAMPSALMICLHTVTLAVMASLGLGAAVSTRVSNELGAGRPHAARLSTRVVMLLGFSVSASEGIVLLLVRNLLGYAYSDDEEVASYTARLMPVLAVQILIDGLQSILSGKSSLIVGKPTK